MKKKLIIALVCGLCLPLASYSSNQCQAYTKIKSIINLASPAKHATLYYIQNTSNHRILLNKVNNHKGGANAGWGSYIEAHQWSALAVTNSPFTLGCFTDQGKSITCLKRIKVCQAKRNFSADTSYWVVESTSFNTLIDTVKKRAQEKF